MKQMILILTTVIALSGCSVLADGIAYRNQIERVATQRTHIYEHVDEDGNTIKMVCTSYKEGAIYRMRCRKYNEDIDG